MAMHRLGAQSLHGKMRMHRLGTKPTSWWPCYNPDNGLALSHYLNQWWIFVSGTLWDIFGWNFSQYRKVIIQENEFKYVCELVATFSWSQHDELNHHLTSLWKDVPVTKNLHRPCMFLLFHVGFTLWRSTTVGEWPHLVTKASRFQYHFIWGVTIMPDPSLSF